MVADSVADPAVDRTRAKMEREFRAAEARREWATRLSDPYRREQVERDLAAVGVGSLDEYDAIVERKVVPLIEKAEVAVRVEPASLEWALREGRLPNALDERDDVVTGRSEGYVDARRAYERREFVLPDDSTPDQHPTYGYLSTPLEDLPASATGAFGRVKVTLKPEAAARATWSYSDSMWMESMAPGMVAPSGVMWPDVRASIAPGMGAHLIDALVPEVGVGERPLPEMTAAERREFEEKWKWPVLNDAGVWVDGAERFAEVRRRRLMDAEVWSPWLHRDFFEAQVDGGVRLEDIARVEFDPTPVVEGSAGSEGRARVTRAVVDRLGPMLDAAGIPWRVWSEENAGAPWADGGVAAVAMTDEMERLAATTWESLPDVEGRARAVAAEVQADPSLLGGAERAASLAFARVILTVPKDWPLTLSDAQEMAQRVTGRFVNVLRPFGPDLVGDESVAASQWLGRLGTLPQRMMSAMRDGAVTPEMSPEEALEALGVWDDERTGVIRQQVAQSVLATRVGASVLRRVLEDGEVKTQHTAGTSKGLFAPVTRAAAENRLVGVPARVPRAGDDDSEWQGERPVSGYLGLREPEGSRGIEGNVNYYGGVRLVWDDALKADAWITFGDSLAVAEARGGVHGAAMRATDPDARLVKPSLRIPMGGLEKPWYTPHGEYVETLIPQRLMRLENLRKVEFPFWWRDEQEWVDVAERIRALGIEAEFVPWLSDRGW